jgi:hypothetical protein
LHTQTLDELITRHGTDVLDHLDRQVSIPVTDRPQIQGDVAILPVTRVAATTPVSPAGVAVVRGENGGNTHSLHGDGPVFYDAFTGGGMTLGILTIPAGSTAWMAHPEHGYMGIAPGNYSIGRQREQADAIRIVAD